MNKPTKILKKLQNHVNQKYVENIQDPSTTPKFAGLSNKFSYKKS
jgi:hypothetical protein